MYMYIIWAIQVTTGNYCMNIYLYIYICISACIYKYIIISYHIMCLYIYMYLPGIYDLRQLWALVTCDLVMCTTAHAHSGPRVFSRRCLWRYEFGNPFLVGGFNHLEKYESQWEGLSHILWNIINVWNHQPVLLCQLHVRAQHGVTSIYKLLSSVFDCLQLRKRNDLPSTLAHQAHGTCARHRHRFRGF